MEDFSFFSFKIGVFLEFLMFLFFWQKIIFSYKRKTGEQTDAKYLWDCTNTILISSGE